METGQKQFIFKYQVKGKTSMSGLGKWGTAFSIISISVVSVSFILFTYLAITSDKKFFIFALIMAILTLLFGPYQMWIKKFYFFGLTTDGILIMKSVVNLIPKSFEIKVSDIFLAKHDNIAKSPAVLFYNRSNKLIAKFNPFMMKYNLFLEYLSEIKKLNPSIEMNLEGLN